MRKKRNNGTFPVQETSSFLNKLDEIRASQNDVNCQMITNSYENKHEELLCY